MFDMGLSEILVIAIVAILFLGPEKLPSTMVQIAKFFKNVKNTVNSVKNTIEEEVNAKSIKDEALAYKKELVEANEKLKSVTDVKTMAAKLTSLEDDSFTKNSLFEAPKDTSAAKADEITLKKKETPTIEDKKNV